MSNFVKLPQEHAEAWYTLRYFDRALGADLFRTFGNDEVIDVPLAALPDVVCRILAVDGRERPTVKRAIKRIIDAGLMVQDGNSTRLLYSRESFRSYRSTTSEWPVNRQSTSGQPSVNGRLTVSQPSVNNQSSSPKCTESNNSVSVDRERDREIERDARTDFSEPQPFWADLGHQSLGQWLTVELKREHTKRNGTSQPPAMGKSWGTAVATLAEWLSEASDPRATVAKLLDGFFADSRAEAAGFPIAWLGNNPTQYLTRASSPPSPSEPAPPVDLLAEIKRQKAEWLATLEPGSRGLS